MRANCGLLKNIPLHLTHLRLPIFVKLFVALHVETDQVTNGAYFIIHWLPLDVDLLG